MAARVTRVIVGYPLTPSVLKKMDAQVEPELLRQQFDPESEWTNTYSIWTCHGYLNDGNDHEGFLKVQRKNTGKDDSFELRIRQEIVHNEAAFNIIDAKIECRNNEISSPLSWNISSTFIGPDGKERPELGKHEECKISRDRILVTHGGKSFKRPGSKRLSADWCMFDAIQRLNVDGNTSLSFDMLEGMGLMRSGHRLRYDGIQASDAVGSSMHHFHQVGHGTFPYDYWLSEEHRLVMAVTMSRAYILDSDAEAKTEEVLRVTREYYQGKKSRMEGSAK